jgi:hypothetical protein
MIDRSTRNAIIDIGYMSVGSGLFLLSTEPVGRFVVHSLLPALGLTSDSGVLGSVAIVIFFLLYAAPFALVARYLLRRFPVDVPERWLPLEDLARARKSLASSVEFLDTLAADIAKNERRRLELEALVESLKAASSESANDLREKLAAIDYVRRRGSYLRTAFTFLLGVLASLAAQTIWSVATKR